MKVQSYENACIVSLIDVVTFTAVLVSSVKL